MSPKEVLLWNMTREAAENIPEVTERIVTALKEDMKYE